MTAPVVCWAAMTGLPRCSSSSATRACLRGVKPSGSGALDERFEALTLVQTCKIRGACRPRRQRTRPCRLAMEPQAKRLRGQRRRQLAPPEWCRPVPPQAARSASQAGGSQTNAELVPAARCATCPAVSQSPRRTLPGGSPVRARMSGGLRVGFKAVGTTRSRCGNRSRAGGTNNKPTPLHTTLFAVAGSSRSSSPAAEAAGLGRRPTSSRSEDYRSQL